MNSQQNKRLVLELWHGRGGRQHPTCSELQAAFADDIEVFGFYPLRRLQGVDCLIEQLWQPLLRAFPDLWRRPTMLLANAYQGRDWVASSGEYIGSFVEDWLGIPANGQSVKFRYGEFCCVQDGKVVEIRLLIDLPELIRQADRAVLPRSYGRDIWVPGPLAGDGVALAPADAAESQKTLAIVEAMIFGGLNKYDRKNQSSQGLERFWHADLVWHGPVGIGSAYGLDEFLRNAQGPIVRAFPDRKGVGHQARLAEGLYAASTGWPSLVGTHQREFLGWPPTHKKVGWNIMDFWRRDGDLLRENWVLIDLIGAALESDVELYPPLRAFESS